MADELDDEEMQEIQNWGRYSAAFQTYKFFRQLSGCEACARRGQIIAAFLRERFARRALES
jgi:hypothetical protein